MRRYQYPHFVAAPWPELVEECRERTAIRPDFEPLRAVAAGIAANEAAEVLAGQLWMEDVAVTSLPMADPPDELVVVSLLPYSGTSGREGWVRVEHRSATGRNDRVDRPAAQAVPLFWRFTIEKFGIHPRPRPALPPVTGGKPSGRGLSPRCPSPSDRTGRTRSGR